MYSTVALCDYLCASLDMAVHLCTACVRQYLHVCFKAVTEAMPSSPSLIVDIQSLFISQGSLLCVMLTLAVGVTNGGAGGAGKTRGEGL